MSSTEIVSLLGREVLDSRSNPTVEAEVRLACGVTCTAIAPSGASTGTFEAIELRDGDMQAYHGKGVTRACKHVSTTICKALRGMDAANQSAIDDALCCADGTENKAKLGANATLAVSMACAKAASAARGIALFKHLGGEQGCTMPMPMMNILNGGAHAGNGLDIQEFMIIPKGSRRFRDALRMCTEVYHTLASILKKRGLSCSVGDEGGFAPDISDETQAIELILEAITHAGYAAPADFVLALDAAASEWKIVDGYALPKSKRTFSTESLIDYWQNLTQQYPILSLEDPLDEEDFIGWQSLTERLGGHCQLVGDDLFVTNPQRIEKGLRLHCANAVLLKPNQIGTLSETMNAHRLAVLNGMKTILSHRSGDSEDTTIADLAVALNCGQIKAGAPCRSERVAKYNRLLRIEDALGCGATLGKAGVHP
ncbi:MAG: phosphopyruvate hydratase [Clostridia bacterium]|nr:phosphopyruvate hydratase [Clostridia bacterium]